MERGDVRSPGQSPDGWDSHTGQLLPCSRVHTLCFRTFKNVNQTFSLLYLFYAVYACWFTQPYAAATLSMFELGNDVCMKCRLGGDLVQCDTCNLCKICKPRAFFVNSSTDLLPFVSAGIFRKASWRYVCCALVS